MRSEQDAGALPVQRLSGGEPEETAQTSWSTGRTGPGLWICTVGEGQATQ